LKDDSQLALITWNSLGKAGKGPELVKDKRDDEEIDEVCDSFDEAERGYNIRDLQPSSIETRSKKASIPDPPPGEFLKC